MSIFLFLLTPVDLTLYNCCALFESKANVLLVEEILSLMVIVFFLVEGDRMKYCAACRWVICWAWATGIPAT